MARCDNIKEATGISCDEIQTERRRTLFLYGEQPDCETPVTYVELYCAIWETDARIYVA